MSQIMNERDSQGLYVLKHKNKDVALVYLNRDSGAMEYVIEVLSPEELPFGCGGNGEYLSEWWSGRAIPDYRWEIRQVLHSLGKKSTQSLMLESYGLSLVDHYWLQPISREMRWEDINFFEKEFSDELGDILMDSHWICEDREISCVSPSTSVGGDMKKKWVMMLDDRYLMKVGTARYGQQSVNERIASIVHQKTGWKNYVPYILVTMEIDGEIYPCAASPMFTSGELEFVSAYQLVRNYKIPNDMSEYEAVIARAAACGLDEAEVRGQLEYTILTDFILTNTDRHYNNFGFLYNSEQHRFVSMAPIFDTANSLFYDREIIPSGESLLDIPVASFRKREVDLLRYISGKCPFALSDLEGMPAIAAQILRQHTRMPGERIREIERAMEEKTAWLQMFLDGKKIWKRKKFWQGGGEKK